VHNAGSLHSRDGREGWRIHAIVGVYVREIDANGHDVYQRLAISWAGVWNISVLEDIRATDLGELNSLYTDSLLIRLAEPI